MKFAWTAAVALLLLACTGAAPASTPVGFGPGQTDAPMPGEPGGRPDGEAQLDTALIVRTGEISVEVSDLAAALEAGRQAITGLGGYVELAEEHHGEFDGYAQVTYRLPVAQWEAALAALRGLGEVQGQTQDARDVTAEVVDLDARLANLRVTESALQAIMDRATTIDDVLAVQRELTKVRGDIESLAAQRDQLADRAALSTLTVIYNVPVEAVAQAAEGWDAGREISGALASLVLILQRLASFGIWLAIVVVPVVAPVIFVIWLVYRFNRRRVRVG